MSGLVPVTVRPELFRSHVQKLVMQEGMTLAEMAANVPDLPAAFWEFGTITVGGQVVPRELWHVARPRVIDGYENVVTMALVPHGGIKGNQWISIVASIALVVGTAWIGAGGLVPLFGEAFKAGTWAAAAAAGGVGLLGSLAIQALVPPPKIGNQRDAKPPIVAGIAGNAARPLEQLQRVLGRVHAPPPYLAPPFSTLRKGNVLIQAVVGWAGRHEIEDIRVNNSDIDENQAVVEYETRNGIASDDPVTICDKTVVQQRDQQTLSEFDLREDEDRRDWLENQANPELALPQWHAYATRGVPDQVWLRLFWPGGIILTTDDGEVRAAAVPFRVQFRIKGESVWINGPEFHFWDAIKLGHELRQEIKFIWQANDTVAGITNDYTAFATVWRAADGETWEYNADSYFDPDDGTNFSAHVVASEDGFLVYLDPDVFPQGVYEFRIKRGLAYRRVSFDIDETRYLWDDLYTGNWFDYKEDAGIKKSFIDQVKYGSTCILDTFTTYSNDYPLPLASELPLTLIAVLMKNATLESITATFTSVVHTWDGADWDTIAASSNPAAHYLHVVRGSLNANPLPESIIDYDSLQDWYEHCDDQGYECNAVVADSLPAVLQLVAAAGWAVPRQNEKWGVIVEKDRTADAITQSFTPLNSRGFSTEKTFADIPDAIYAEFYDETDEFKLKSRTVYGDLQNSSTAETFQSISYAGITHPDQIEARARLDWRQIRYRQARRSIEIGAESLLSGRGDLVGLTHDVIDSYADYGIVDAVLTSGGNVTGLLLQAKVRLPDIVGTPGAAIRYADGSIVEKQIATSTENTKTITFTTPFTIPGGDVLTQGCLVGVGVLSSVYRRSIIFDIAPGPDFTARLTLIDEAPEIHGPVLPMLDFSQARNSQYLPAVM